MSAENIKAFAGACHWDEIKDNVADEIEWSELHDYQRPNKIRRVEVIIGKRCAGGGHDTSLFVQCNACTGGFSLLAESYYAGWRCDDCIEAGKPDKGLDLGANQYHLKKKH